MKRVCGKQELKRGCYYDSIGRVQELKPGLYYDNAGRVCRVRVDKKSREGFVVEYPNGDKHRVTFRSQAYVGEVFPGELRLMSDEQKVSELGKVIAKLEFLWGGGVLR
ncbi:hypothetical protein CMI37_34055 [Candidatus Pacearchaeota archaeon]|nr:hypothetical protein [Candidatus Pacearchaeota archaeon]